MNSSIHVDSKRARDIGSYETCSSPSGAVLAVCCSVHCVHASVWFFLSLPHTGYASVCPPENVAPVHPAPVRPPDSPSVPDSCPASPAAHTCPAAAPEDKPQAQNQTRTNVFHST